MCTYARSVKKRLKRCSIRSGGVHLVAGTGLLLDEQLTLVPESMPRPRDVDMDMHADGLPNTVAEPALTL